MLDPQEFERRRTERHTVEAPANVSDDGAVRVVNVSSRGLETESGERMLVGTHCEVGVDWRGERLAVHGNVVWSKLDRTVLTRAGEIRPVYRSGIEAASASIPMLERMTGGGGPS